MECYFIRYFVASLAAIYRPLKQNLILSACLVISVTEAGKGSRSKNLVTSSTTGAYHFISVDILFEILLHTHVPVPSAVFVHFRALWLYYLFLNSHVCLLFISAGTNRNSPNGNGGLKQKRKKKQTGNKGMIDFYIRGLDKGPGVQVKDQGSSVTFFKGPTCSYVI